MSHRAISTPVMAVMYWPPCAPAKIPFIADPLPDRLHVQGILANQHAAKTMHQGSRAHRRIGRFALPEDSLVGINAHVGLWTVHSTWAVRISVIFTFGLCCGVL